jgi:hypothetical protein
VKLLVPVLVWLGLSACAMAQDGQWITFKTARNSCGRIDHQFDVKSIRQEGHYKTFWAREWIADKRQPVMFSLNEALFAVSLEYAVDCRRPRFGSHLVSC